MRNTLDIIIVYLFGTILVIPLVYSLLFLIKAIFKPESISNFSSFFESPFKARLFNLIVAKSFLSIMFLICVFLIYLMVSRFFFDGGPSSVIWRLIGTILYMLYSGLFMGIIYGLGKVSGAGGSSKQVYHELFNLFSGKGNKLTKSRELHNKANEADVK